MNVDSAAFLWLEDIVENVAVIIDFSTSEVNELVVAADSDVASGFDDIIDAVTDGDFVLDALVDVAAINVNPDSNPFEVTVDKVVAISVLEDLKDVTNVGTRDLPSQDMFSTPTEDKSIFGSDSTVPLFAFTDPLEKPPSHLRPSLRFDV